MDRDAANRFCKKIVSARPFRHLDEKRAYPANLCPIQRGGAMSYSRLHTIILQSRSGDCKRFL
jgi:hypothetical protein